MAVPDATLRFEASGKTLEILRQEAGDPPVVTLTLTVDDGVNQASVPIDRATFSRFLRGADQLLG